jgi:hypothetical protein
MILILEGISVKAGLLSLSPDLKETHDLALVDINLFLKADWYGTPPDEKSFEPTRLYGDNWADKYERFKDFAKKNKAADINAPYITAFTKDGSIYSMEGNHRFYFFLKKGAKEIAMGIPKKNRPSPCDWIIRFL